MSYNLLVPGDTQTTNALLAQISQQLSNLNNQSAANLNSTFASDNQFTPSAAAIRVNVIWFLSLILTTASALNATLFQQWSRRYLEITRHRVAPHKRARTRAYMFHGIAGFKMSRAVKAMPLLLHSSIFLFFAGLIDYLWQANSIVGISVLCFVSAVTLAYLVFTVLPNLYLDCPYSTPVSELSWRLSQCLFLFILHLVQGLESLFSRYRTRGSISWTQWRQAVNNQIKERRKWVKLGLQKSIHENATKATSQTDEAALAWTLSVLDDDREFEDFVARVPGFFDSSAVDHAPSVLLSLMNDQPSQPELIPILGSSINDLLKTCVPGISPLREELRKNRLRVCMRTLWYFGKEYNRPANTTPLPSYVRSIFANSEMTRRIQSEEDIAARLIGRCFSSFIAKKITQDIGNHTAQSRPQANRVAELSCLAAILDKTSRQVAILLNQPSTISLANIASLTSSEMDTLAKGRVPSEVQDIFQKTLDILLRDLLALPHDELPPDLVAIFHETYTNAQQLRAPDWLLDRLRQISEWLSMVLDEPEVPRLALPESEPGSSNISRGGSASPLLGNVMSTPL
jgi:hypothetical protein